MYSDMASRGVGDAWRDSRRGTGRLLPGRFAAIDTSKRGRRLLRLFASFDVDQRVSRPTVVKSPGRPALFSKSGETRTGFGISLWCRGRRGPRRRLASGHWRSPRPAPATCSSNRRARAFPPFRRPVAARVEWRAFAVPRGTRSGAAYRTPDEISCDRWERASSVHRRGLVKNGGKSGERGSPWRRDAPIPRRKQRDSPRERVRLSCATLGQGSHAARTSLPRIRALRGETTKAARCDVSWRLGGVRLLRLLKDGPRAPGVTASRAR